MKSFKCEYCNLTNWIDVIVCKRCQMPNANLPEHAGIYDQNNNLANTQVDFAEQTPITQDLQFGNETRFANNNTHASHGSYQQHNPNLPPPPNYYGQRPGNANYSNGYSQHNPPQAHSYQESFPPEVLDSLDDAKIYVRRAWTASKVYMVLWGIGLCAILLVIVLITNVALNYLLILGFLFSIALFMIFNLLCKGVRDKKLGCAITLVVLFSLSILGDFIMIGTGLTSGENLISSLVALLMIYFYGNAIRGIIVYNQIIKAYPNIDK